MHSTKIGIGPRTVPIYASSYARTPDQANDVACKVLKEVVVEEIVDDDACGATPMENEKSKPSSMKNGMVKNSRANRKH